MPTPPMSDVTTQGIRVGATAFYLPEHSHPDDNDFVFGYRILIVNNSPETVELLSRHWYIIDGEGDCQEITGEGVVGQQPVLEPGMAFKYTSFARLPTHWGTMEGRYTFRRQHSGEEFEVSIGRFWLTTETTAVGAGPDGEGGGQQLV